VRTYTYDNRNRETFSDWSAANTPDIGRAYDAASRLLFLTNSVSALSYAYNDANEVTSETQDIAAAAGGSDPAPRTIGYSYTLDSLIETLTYPGGTVVTNAYTGRNQVATITADGPPPLASYTYDLGGNRTGKSLENGMSSSYAFDDASRMTNIVHSAGASVFASFGYGYDSVDRRTFVKRENGKGDVFGYDAIDQVTSVLYEASNPDSAPVAPLREVSYALDAAGNRVSVTDNLRLTAYSSNNLNQYTQVGTGSLTYNINGNLTSHDGWTYTYDAQNRLTSATKAGTTILFAYDPANRVVRRQVNGVKTLLYYDSWNLIEERNGTGQGLARYIHGAVVDEILVWITADPPVYYHHDSIGSTTHLTDVAGAVVEKYTYDIFGAPSIFAADGSPLTASAFGNRFLFTGREKIPETELLDFRNRVYHPGLGRFLQTDPIRFEAADVNLYRYVANNTTVLIADASHNS